MVGALALGGCSAGQITQTDTQASGVGGGSANVGQIAVREAAFPFTGDGKTAVIYPAGGTAPLTMTVVNFGGQEDKLTGVSSPVAGSAKITGDATVEAGHVLLVKGEPAGPPAPASGSAAPAAPTRAPGTAPTATAKPTEAAAPTGPNTAGDTTAQVVLTGLKEDLTVGPAYPVVLTFQRAGQVTVDVPVANPPENEGANGA